MENSNGKEKGENSGWKEMLEEAKRKHAEGKKYVARMRATIRFIERQITDSVCFPIQDDKNSKDSS
jgi:hypothetical protein